MIPPAGASSPAADAPPTVSTLSSASTLNTRLTATQAFVGTPAKDKYKEAIEFEAVHVEKSLASAWTPYVFYVNGKVSHCGTNSFQLVKTDDGWKIQYIIEFIVFGISKELLY